MADNLKSILKILNGYTNKLEILNYCYIVIKRLILLPQQTIILKWLRLPTLNIYVYTFVVLYNPQLPRIIIWAHYRHNIYN